MSRKVLVSGATGAMGQYLVPRLAELGYEITALSLDEMQSSYKNVHYLKNGISIVMPLLIVRVLLKLF